ncbi:MAG TPA: MarR family transcriptional regulator [Pirellulaceae bacterium]|nr:MarR family transcriptional regulator [Pirellulaceae bacterium]
MANHAPSAAGRKQGRRFDSPQQEVYLSLWRTYDRLRMIEDELFLQHDLTAQQYNALRLLKAEHPGTLPTLVLAGRLVSHAPDITRLVDRLQDRGLVARQRMPDNRRVVQVGITDAGLALLKELEQPVRECHLKQLGHLPPAQLQSLVELLRIARQPHEDEGSPW